MFVDMCKYVRVARRALGCCLICDFHSDSTLFSLCCCYFFAATAVVVVATFLVIIVDVRSLKLELMCISSVGVVLLSG